MPENRQNQNNAVSTSSNATAVDNLEGPMWRLKIQVPDNQEGVDGNSTTYPNRPNGPDCIYYLNTGLCRYGSSCHFNHPANTGQATQARNELPERDGQPDCQFFLKTGTCKFGATCKYHHPRDRHGAAQVPLNMLGLPMRKEEKSCAFYMRTGSCKFGIACKFNHPQPLGLPSPVSATAYGSMGSSAMPSSSLPYVGGFQTWTLPRAPYTTAPRVQGPTAYMPVVFSPSQGVMPAQQGWSTYTSSISPLSSTDALGSNMFYSSKLPGDPGSSGQMHLLSTSFQQYPERPDQPECQYYLKTGSCKFGQACKYHHPREKSAPFPAGTVGPLGLPLRPGHPVCTSYCAYGICKYGSTCKYDHPLAGYYSYSLPALSVLDPSSLPYMKNSQITHSSSETSPSKAANSSDRITKPEGTATKPQKSDTEAPEELAQQTLSVSETHTPPNSSESPHDQSD